MAGSRRIKFVRDEAYYGETAAVTKDVEVPDYHVRLSRSIKPNALIRVSTVSRGHLRQHDRRPDSKGAKHRIV